MNLEQT